MFVLERPERGARPLLLGAHDRGAGRRTSCAASSAATASAARCASTPTAEAAYTDEIAAAAASTPWMTGGCRNWYVDERSGRLTLLWPGTVDAFRDAARRAPTARSSCPCP